MHVIRFQSIPQSLGSIMSSTRIQIAPASRDATQGKLRVPAGLLHGIGNLLHKWRPVVFIILFLGVFVTPFYGFAQTLESSDGCSAVSDTPKRDTESTVSNPGTSASTGFESYPGTPSQILAKSRCIFDSNLERVDAALSASLSDSESAVNAFAATVMGSISVLWIVFFILAGIFCLYYWVNRKGSPDRKKPSDDDLSMRARGFVGPVAWMLLAFSLLYSQNALALLYAPSKNIVALSTAGPLSTDNLSNTTYRIAELNPFGSVMYGYDRESEFKTAATHIDSYLSGKPVSEKEYKYYAALYNQRVIGENKAGSMQNTAKAVERFGTSLNVTSYIVSRAVSILETAVLAIVIGSSMVLLVTCAMRPVRGRRYFKRWSFTNVVPFGLLCLSLLALLAVNWGGVYFVSFITAPERSGIVWGWTISAYAVQLIGYIVPWLLLYSVYRYYRHTSGWLLQSMVKSDDKWIQDVGKALVAAREQRVITGRLLLKIPYFRRKMVTASSTGATP